MDQLNLDNVTINKIRKYAKILNAADAAPPVKLYGQTKKGMARAFAATMDRVQKAGHAEHVPTEVRQFYHDLTGNGTGGVSMALVDDTEPVDNLDAIAAEVALGKNAAGYTIIIDPGVEMDDTLRAAAEAGANIVCLMPGHDHLVAMGTVLRTHAPATRNEIAVAVNNETLAILHLFDQLGLTWADTDGKIHFK